MKAESANAPPECTDDDIAVKSFFLGPCAENGDWLQEQLSGFLRHGFAARRAFSEADGAVIPAAEQANAAFRRRQSLMEEKTRILMKRFEKELPKFSPRYMGHMFSELSMPALLGHWVALLQNPNNISKEASHVGLEIEREAVRMLLTMFGFGAHEGTGHFTSGGTIANFEAVLRARARQKLWISLGAYLHEKTGAGPSFFEAAHWGWDAYQAALPAGDERRDFRVWCETLGQSEHFVARVEAAYREKWISPTLIISAGAHYSWMKSADFFGIARESVIQIPLDRRGRLDTVRLRSTLAEMEARKRPVMMVVSLAGSTEFGTVEPIAEIHRALRENTSWKTNIWHHVDAAFGGFFASLTKAPTAVLDRPDALGGLSPTALGDLAAIGEATSVTVDPHKMAYVPYASGVFLCADHRDYPHHRVDAPYIDFDEGSDPGLHTLEGSRAATGAAATWLTGQSIGFDGDGYGRILQRTIAAKRVLEVKLKEHFGDRVLIPPGLDLNIVCFALGPEKKLSVMNAATNALFAKSGTARLDGYSVSRTAMKLDSSRLFLRDWLTANEVKIDDDRAVFIRSCLMNPFLTSRQAKVDFLSGFIQAVDRAIRTG